MRRSRGADSDCRGPRRDTGPNRVGRGERLIAGSFQCGAERARAIDERGVSRHHSQAIGGAELNCAAVGGVHAISACIGRDGENEQRSSCGARWSVYNKMVLSRRCDVDRRTMPCDAGRGLVGGR